MCYMFDVKLIFTYISVKSTELAVILQDFLSKTNISLYCLCLHIIVKKNI